MKYAVPLAIAAIIAFPSCATQPTAAAYRSSAPGVAPSDPASDPAPNPTADPVRKAYRGAQHAAGAINMVRTFGSLF